MFKLLSISLLLLHFYPTEAQHPDPIHWTYTATTTDGHTYTLHITATIDEGWHAYSQTQPKSAVAQPTILHFEKSPLLQFVGQPKEVGKLINWSDKATGIAARQYKHQVDFVQTVRLKTSAKVTVTGTLTFQACTEEMCLPPKTVSFAIPLTQPS